MRILTERILIVTISVVATTMFFSCKKESNPVQPTDSRPILTSTDYGNVVLTLSDYVTVKVTHQGGLDLRSPNIIHIGFGTKDSTGYTQSYSTPTTYDPNAGAYIIHFDFSVRLDSSKAVVPLTVRYYFTDSSHTDIDTTVLAYKYPYPTAELVAPFSVLEPVLGQSHLQDVDRLGSSVFFHPTGDDGLYSFDIGTQAITTIFEYPSGDFIAADSIFVFVDLHFQIWRFNLETDSVDLMIPGTGIPYDIVRGMDVYDRYLYVTYDFSGMRKYTLDGVLVDSIALPQHSNPFTFIDSTVYILQSTFNILRYDMRTGVFLENVQSPSRRLETMKIHRDKLYYCDLERKTISSVPIADLRAVQ